MTQPTEEWLPFPGWEGCYEVSSAGRVRSLERYIKLYGRWGLYKRKKPSFVLSPGMGGSGYLFVNLYNNNEKLMRMVHRMVAITFIPCPSVTYDVCHNDGNRLNNNVSNLRWDTRAGNCADMIKHGTQARGLRNGMAKLTDEEVGQIRNASGKLAEIAAAFDISVGYASAIRLNKYRVQP